MCVELKIKTNVRNNISIILYYNLELHMQRSIFSKCNILNAKKRFDFTNITF